jgi:hypothetical protein
MVCEDTNHGMGHKFNKLKTLASEAGNNASLMETEAKKCN